MRAENVRSLAELLFTVDLRLICVRRAMQMERNRTH